MATTIIIVIIYALLIAYFAFKSYDFGEFMLMAVITTIATGVVWTIVNIAIGLIWYGEDSGRSIRTDIEQTELSALSSSSEVSGSFFLGSGSIDDKPVYSYILKNEDGGLELKTISTSSVIVYEVENMAVGYMERAYITPESDTWTYFSDQDKTRFYVPAGSVQTQEYSVTTK